MTRSSESEKHALLCPEESGEMKVFGETKLGSNFVPLSQVLRRENGGVDPLFDRDTSSWNFEHARNADSALLDSPYFDAYYEARKLQHDDEEDLVGMFGRSSEWEKRSKKSDGLQYSTLLQRCWEDSAALTDHPSARRRSAVHARTPVSATGGEADSSAATAGAASKSVASKVAMGIGTRGVTSRDERGGQRIKNMG